MRPALLFPFCLIPLTTVIAATTPEAEPDRFAEIANQRFAERVKGVMETPAPPALPETRLAWNGGAPAAKMPRVDTPEKLKTALAALREKMAPFLAEHQPEKTDTRIVVPIDAMDFRRETAADRNDFTHTLSGGGDWRRVNIPHYTGAGEQAVAWYRTTVTVTDAMLAKGRMVACFDGVDYFADVFVNGHHAGAHEGYFGPFECDFSAYAKKGPNTILVRVRNSSRFTVGSSETGETPNRAVNIPRTFGDKLQSCNTPGWDDPHFGWNGTPNGFGIARKLVVEARPAVAIGDVFARPKLTPEGDSVELFVELENPSEQNGVAVIKASVFGRNFRQVVVKPTAFKHDPRIAGWNGQPAPGSLHGKQGEPICKITGTRPRYKLTIPIADARRWTLDAPWLYTARITVEDLQGRVTDVKDASFGLRSFEQRLDTTPIGRYYLNGREIRLRGANEMGNFQLDVLRKDWKQLIDDILLAKLTNMNFLRCTQTVMPPEFYDYCDRLGLIAQSDLPLFSKLSRKKTAESVKQAAEMARVVRSHPCNGVVSFFNEPDDGDGTGGHAYAHTRAEVEEFFKAATVAVKLENPDQVIKLVDGDYNPPSLGQPDNHCYSGWYGDHFVSQRKIHEGHWGPVLKGWMVGCGEFGGEGLDSVETMRALYPPEWVTPAADGTWKPSKIEGSQTWNMHAAWYETPKTMEDWVKVSQTHQANITRVKAEAFRRMSRMNTFAIHLFIDAWPNGWLKTIMDVRREPKPAWFAYRDALEPLVVQIRSPWDDRAPKLSAANADTWSYQKNTFATGDKAEVELWIANDRNDKPDCELVYQLEMNGTVIRTGRMPAGMPDVTEGSRFQGRLPIEAPAVEKPATALLRASLVDASGAVLSQYDFPIRILPATTK